MNESYDDYLTISLTMQSMQDRNLVNLDYEMTEGNTGALSVYKKFDNPQFVVYLRDIDIEGQTTFRIHIDETDLVNGKTSFKLIASFSDLSSDNECTIYWGDGEMNEEIISSGYTEPINGSIVKDGVVHTYIHYYYSSGDFSISIGNGLQSFKCGDESDRSDNSKGYVIRCVSYSDSEYLTSVSGAFKNCINMSGDIPAWGSSIVNASQTYYGCSSLAASAIPNWNDGMTDISECYYGCTGIGS